MSDPSCFFAGFEDVTACDGRLVRAHLISKQELRKAFPKGAWKDGDFWLPRLPFEALTDTETAAGWTHRTLDELQADPRVWVPCCGGMTGIGGHHGQLDNPNSRLRVPRDLLPAAVDEFAVEYRIEMVIDRLYGPQAIEEAA